MNSPIYNTPVFVYIESMGNGAEHTESIKYGGFEFIPVEQGYTLTPEANILILGSKPSRPMPMEELDRLENISYTEVYQAGRNCLFIQTLDIEGGEENGVLVPEINGGIIIKWVPALNTEGKLILVPALSPFPEEYLDADNYIVAAKLLTSIGHSVNSLHTEIEELFLATNVPTIGVDGLEFGTVICTREELDDLKWVMYQFIKPTYINQT